MIVRTRIIHEFEDGRKLAVDMIADDGAGFAGSGWSEPYEIEAPK
jgi:hypothetical protein